jgi:hypothetical protein
MKMSTRTSTGSHSIGNRSTGNRSVGNRSTGNWSISNYSSGHFSTEDYAGFGAFNKPCSQKDWDDAKKPDLLFFTLTEFVHSRSMTSEEKTDNPSHKTAGGYLKTYEYKEAFQESYAKASKEDRDLLLELPNFDPDVFLEISGIDVRAEEELRES